MQVSCPRRLLFLRCLPSSRLVGSSWPSLLASPFVSACRAQGGARGAISASVCSPAPLHPPPGPPLALQGLACWPSSHLGPRETAETAGGCGVIPPPSVRKAAWKLLFRAPSVTCSNPPSTQLGSMFSPQFLSGGRVHTHALDYSFWCSRKGLGAPAEGAAEPCCGEEGREGVPGTSRERGPHFLGLRPPPTDWVPGLKLLGLSLGRPWRLGVLEPLTRDPQV